MAVLITSPRPPLNVFDVKHMAVNANWNTIYETPSYIIPAVGPNPQREVQAVALLTSLIVTNTEQNTIEVSVRVVDDNGQIWAVLNELPVPANDFALIELSKQNLPSGEQLQIRVAAAQAAVAHLSFVLNQREEFEVV